MSFGSLLSVFRLLASTATAVRTSDIFFLFGFGPYLVVVTVVAGAAAPPDDATLDDGVDVVALTHVFLF